MRKCAKWRNLTLILCLCCAPAAAQISAADNPPDPQPNALSRTLVERAQQQLARIKALVDDGTLPKSQLAEAEAKVADAEDDAILSETLYGQPRVQDLTSAEAAAMVDAAQRRLERQERIVADRRGLLDSGIISQSEFRSYLDELETRRSVLELARNRAKLLEDLQRMAEAEQRFERAAQASKGALIRYDGNGLFSLDDLPAISAQFEKRFHHALPISALGQTLVHQWMGLDHRNRVDVALNPDQPEGVWLRQLLERLHVPYLAFRSAMAGAATAPHIHIGTGSTRLKLASR
jgi:hypothetical protein